VNRSLPTQLLDSEAFEFRRPLRPLKHHTVRSGFTSFFVLLALHSFEFNCDEYICRSLEFGNGILCLGIACAFCCDLFRRVRRRSFKRLSFPLGFFDVTPKIHRAEGELLTSTRAQAKVFKLFERTQPQHRIAALKRMVEECEGAFGIQCDQPE